MVIRGELKDKHFVHIDEICYGQVFVNKKNEIYMKIRNKFSNEQEGKDCFAACLKYGDIVNIDREANLRLLNCSLDINGFVVN